MDSGVGGLAVLHRFAQQLPSSPYVFIGDTARMPYGEKPLSVVRDRVLNVHRWIDGAYPLSVFVLACNTATVACYDNLEALNLPYPVLEPVKTTSQWVNTHVPTGKKIGILATPGTVNSGRYLRFLDAHWETQQVACPGLASLIESGVCQGKELEDAILPFLTPLQQWGAEAIILGCTHYSLIQSSLQQIVGTQVDLIDSAEVLAKVAIPIIQTLNMGSGPQELIVTGDAQRFQEAIDQLPLDLFRGKAVSNIAIGEELPLA